MAREIDQATRAYAGPRWEKADGKERAVRILIVAPSLQGQRPDELQDGCTTFHTAVQLTESHTYRDGAGYTRSARLLHSFSFEMEVKDGAYTGQVTVHERSFDHDL